MGEREVGRSSWGGGATGVCVRAGGRACVGADGCACACGCVQRVVSPRVGWRARAGGRTGCATAGVVVVLAIVAVRRAVVVSGSGGDGERGRRTTGYSEYARARARACAGATTRNRHVVSRLVRVKSSWQLSTACWWWWW